MKIYVMCHKEFHGNLPELYVPLQVGAEIHADLNMLKDNTGENISAKNPYYCELTGLYWMWKNSKEDILGLCHYRRFFVKNEKLLTKGYIRNVLREYDLIVPKPAFLGMSVYDQYAETSIKSHMDICRDVVKVLYPDYLGAFDLHMENAFITACNMFIAKKEVMDRYCEWLFPLLFQVEKMIQKEVDSLAEDDQNRRVYGYLSERLFRVWMLNRPVKVREEMVEKTEE